MKKIRQKRYPNFDLVKTSHLLDSIWIKKDKTELKIVFTVGDVLEFKPIKN